MQLLTQRGRQRAKPQRVQFLDSNSASVFRGAVGPWEFAQPPRASLSLSCKMEPLEESERERKREKNHRARGLLGIWSAHQYFLRVCVRMCLPHRGMEWNRATGFHFSSQLSVFPGDGTRST